MPDHRQNHGEQVMQHIPVLEPEMSQERGKVTVSSVCMLEKAKHSFL